LKNINIRIIIPAYNANATIKECVFAIYNSLSTFNNYEIIIVDNGLNNKLNSLLEEYSVKIIKATKIQSAAYARNYGAKNFNDGIIIFIDSDVIIEKECIRVLLSPIITGVASATIGNYSKNIDGLNFAQKYKQLYINHIYSKENINIQNDYWTAISAVKADVFHTIQGFDNSFKGANGEDQDFGIRLTKNNYKISTTLAFGKHLNPFTIKKLILNDFRKGVTAMNNSINNNVSVLDNRHANLYSILAVLTASFLIFLLPLNLYYNVGYISLIFFVIWFKLRYSLLKVYIKNDLLFILKSIILTFFLDLIRALSVIFTYIRRYL